MTKSMRFLVFFVAATVLLLFLGCPNQFQSDTETTQFSSVEASSADGATTLPIPTRPSVAELVELRNALPAGRIVAWGVAEGFTDHGQVSDTPTGLDALGFVAVAGGASHSLALHKDGYIVGWGGWRSNRDGEATPPEGNEFVAIAGGAGHSVALHEEGYIVGWGRDGYGQATPPEGSDFVAIDAGQSHSLALRADGTIVAWGNDEAGQVSQTPDYGGFVAIAAGCRKSFALHEDGYIVGWGGREGWKTPPEGNDFVAIAACCIYQLALRADGSIVAWGWSHPTNVPPDGNDFRAIAVGDVDHHAVALRQDSTLIAWGYDLHGVMDTTPEDGGFVAIDGGAYHMLAIQLTTSQRVAALKEEVAKLDGLNRGQQRALLATLDAAARSLENGRDHVAANQLGAFVNQVQAFQRSRRLSDNDAEALIRGAETLLGDLTA